MNQEIKARGYSSTVNLSDSSAFYANYWAEGDLISKVSKAKTNYILSDFYPQRPENKCILEIGVGGEGGIIHSLKDTNNVFGVDISSSAQRNCWNLGLKIILQNVDRDPLPFEDETIDIVFATEVFEHFAAPQYVLNEISRVLKTEGVLIISTPNPMVPHWPRLFYPVLFQEREFKEFLMVNRFQIVKKGNFGLNYYRKLLTDSRMRAWSWFWLCKKIGNHDAQELLENGKYFWEQKNELGIRTRPMEAIELFRASCEIDCQLTEARLLLARSLVYRVLSNETKEFLEYLRILVEMANNAKYPENMEAVNYFCLIYVDLKTFGIDLIDQDTFEKTLDLLRQFSNSDDRVRSLMNKLKHLETLHQSKPASLSGSSL